MTEALSLTELSKLKEFKYNTDDIELLAKYIYLRKYGKNKSKIQCFANSEKGLRECFVKEDGTMKSFKTLHNFLANHLGFSSYTSNHSFLVKYLLNIADKLNSMNTTQRIENIKKCIQENPDDIIYLIKKLEYLNNYTLLSDIQYSHIENDKFSFLYDVLCQEDIIEEYHNTVFQKVDRLFSEEYKRIDANKIHTLLYAIIFFILYQFDKNFFEHWKSYYSQKDYERLFGQFNRQTDNKYYSLKELAQTFYNFLSEYKLGDFLSHQGNYQKVIYPYLIFIELIVKQIFPSNYIFTLQGYYLYDTKGGGILTNSFMLNKYFGCNSGNTMDVRHLIEHLSFIDLSGSLFIPPNRRIPNFRERNTLPSIINTIVLKCWIYYSKDRVSVKEKLSENLHSHFSSHFFISFKSSSSSSAKPRELKNFFDNEYIYPDSTTPLYEIFNKFFYNKNSKITKNFFEMFSEYEYRYIKNLDPLIEQIRKEPTLFPSTLINLFGDNELTKRNYITQSPLAMNKMLDEYLN